MPIARQALGVAAWMRYVTGMDERGRPIDVRDPLLKSFRDKTSGAGRDAPRIVGSLLGLKAIFGDDLPADQRFRQAVSDALTNLYSLGSRQTIERLATRRVCHKNSRLAQLSVIRWICKGNGSALPLPLAGEDPGWGCFRQTS